MGRKTDYYNTVFKEVPSTEIQFLQYLGQFLKNDPEFVSNMDAIKDIYNGTAGKELVDKQESLCEAEADEYIKNLIELAAMHKTIASIVRLKLNEQEDHLVPDIAAAVEGINTMALLMPFMGEYHFDSKATIAQLDKVTTQMEKVLFEAGM